MKNVIIRGFSFIILTFFFTFSAIATPITYTFDPSHSYVLWHINHLGFSNPSGKWFVNGTVVLDQAKPENSSVNALIQINEMDTGIPKLDEHLKGPEFFDVAKYPTATFVSTQVHLASANSAWVLGKLTLHGVTKPVTLEIKLNKTGINQFTKKPAVGFSGSAQINRSDFGISSYKPELGNIVTLDIEAEAQANGSPSTAPSSTPQSTSTVATPPTTKTITTPANNS